MASDSSSAVLELNDDANESSEAPSIMDPQDGAPLIMENGHDIAVKVDSPLKQLSTLETYVSYRVRCVCARWQTPPYVRRRYNHFRLLHKRLSSSSPLTAPPALPPLHSARQQLDRYSPSFVAVRTQALDIFLNRVARHPIMSHSEDLRVFLTAPDDQVDKQLRCETSSFNIWRLGTSSTSSSSASSDHNNTGCRVKDPEFAAAADYLLSLQQKLSTLCSLMNKLYKGSNQLSVEYMNLKVSCDAWSCQSLASAPQAVSLGAAAACRSHAAPAPASAPAALLPLLAAECSAHVDKVKQRDGFHAAYVAGNHSDELHNRLEQASEALRSELSDWIPNTRAEIKHLLLDLAERQVRTHTQAVIGWENALRMSTETNLSEMFKTVSKSALHNLSPSKSGRSGSRETDRDLDDISCSNDSESQDVDCREYKSQDVDCGESESGSDFVQIPTGKKTEMVKSETAQNPLQDMVDVDLSL